MRRPPRHIWVAMTEISNVGKRVAATPEQARFVGDQAGGRVFLFLATDDFDRDFAAFTAAGVEWVRPPAVQPYGKVAVFRDLYGNLWDLVQFADRD
ncbi:VOC family protein [Sphingomonas sp. UNC305MFCol5.2]|uniref:VOC family protein n=1 Tax=Sphingomonas sp. UNC305MFCol5.2 TaxID=1449076 RepID=UPI0012DEABC8|nr:VOC family protein [Sphingomonas sp. UNC305MFCol5.2]